MTSRPARGTAPGASEAVPDRSLDPPGTLATIAVRSAGLHPFVYKKMVIGPVGASRPADGDLVRVVDRDEIHLGYGLWNGRSQIQVRLVSQEDAPPDSAAWERRLDDAIALRHDLLRLPESTNAYRVLHAEADRLSGLIVDRFDETLSAEVFSIGIYQRVGPLMRALASRLGTKHFRVHVDERIALAEDFAGRPVASAGAPEQVVIREHDLRYRVRFAEGHKTGFFCDQRDNRRELARFCADRTVLDVCCYTGGFTLNALKGGARDVTGVDLDEKAIALARENADLNQKRPSLVHADAFGYMRQMGLNGRKYDVLVLDPPKLIPGRLDIASGKRKYFDLNVLAMGLVAPGGLFLSCSCSGLLSRDEFLVLLRAAARKAGREARVLALTGASPDHPVGLEALEGSYLKAAWLQMGGKTPDRTDHVGETDGEGPAPDL